MTSTHVQVALAGAIPALVAMWFVDRLDAKRPEPASLRRLVVLAGMLSTIPAIFLELVLTTQVGGQLQPIALTYQGASFQSFIDDCVARGDVGSVDYIHGDGVLERQAMAEGCVGLHLAPLGKGELLRRVVQQGPLPRKTFSMGEAHEKRYYIEARRITAPPAATH